MSNYNRRYIVLKDEALDSSEVTSVKSTTVPPSSEETKTEMYGEGYRSPSVSEDGDAPGDLSISASGNVREQNATNPNIDMTYVYGKGPSLKDIRGEGLITTTGSTSASRFTVSRGDDNAYNLRTTPNYFNRLPFTLDRIQHDWTLSIPEQQNYSRSDVLSLKNGSLVTAYLKSNSASWTWNFASNLIGEITPLSPAVTIQNTYNDTVLAGSNNSVVQISNLTFTSGSITDLSINMVLADSATITESTNIFKIESIDTAGNTINLSTSTFGLYTLHAHLVDNWDNKPGADLKLRYTDENEGTWTTANLAYPETGDFPNLTGVSLVQFEDTEEVLVLTSGWQGSASDFGSSSTFLTVDHIQSDFGSSISSFASSIQNGSIVDRRSVSVLLEFEGWLTQSVKTDVAGLVEGGVPLDITAQVLPSGRLVCVVAFPKKIVSLVSDDRGMSFSATEIMSLQFGGSDEQLFVSVDSTLTDDGQMVLLLIANPIGNRAYSDTTPSSSDFLPSSIVSLFITSSGTSWSDEKNIGTNLSQVAYPQATGVVGGSYPFNFSTWLDESVYGFDGSVCFTAEGHLLVSLCTLNLGGPGCQQGGHLYQRVITPSELNAGLTSQQLAPSLPPVIFSSNQPVTASYSRLGMAIPYLAKDRDSSELLGADVSPIIRDYMHSISPTASYAFGDCGYLGSAYFAGKVDVGSTALLPKLYGGGPSFARGPISVSTTLHNGEVVTVLGETWESSPSDSPNSQFYLRSRISQRSLESTIHVLRSGGLQPLRVNLPNQLRRFDVALSADGKVIDSRFDDGGTSGSAGAEGSIRMFGVNTQNFVDPVAKSFETEQDLTSVQTSLATQTRTISIGSLSFSISTITSSGGVFTVTCSGPDSFDEVFDGAFFSIPGIAGVTNSTVKDAGSVFGSNSFQVSLLGAKDPTYWGWQINTNDSAQASYVADAAFGVSYANKWEIDTPSGAALPYLYYKFAAGLNGNSPYEEFAFPNTKGEALLKESGPEYGSTKLEANSFVCRTVIQIQKGGARGSTTLSTDSGPIRCGVSVVLAQGGLPYGTPDDPTAVPPNRFVGLALSIARISDTVYFSLIELGRSGGSDTYQMITNSEISMTDEGTGSNVYEKVPFYEVVWGLRAGTPPEYAPFIFVRKLRSVDDPKSQDPFTSPSLGMSTIDESAACYQGEEIFRFGSYTDAFNVSGGNAVQCSFAAVQMSRSYLMSEKAFAEMYAPDASAAYRGSIPTSMEAFTETLHIVREPALDFLRSANAGQMAPMAFSNATVFPQEVDNGIELSFRGRATAQASFSYEAKSKFPANSIVNPPVKDGWRSPTETISFDVTTEDTTVELSIPRLPTYEMTFYSEEGFNPEACALFGLNTASVRIDFNSNSTFGDYGSATQPDFTMLFTTPGDPSSLLFNYYNNADLIQDADTSPPASVSGGQQFLVLPGATGAWVGQDGKIATYNSLSASYTFAAASRGDAVVLQQSLTGVWYLYVGSLTWIEYFSPRIFYKPVYLQHFVKYSLSNPSQELVSDRTWEFSGDAPNTVFFKKNNLVNFEVEDVLDATPGNPSGFTGESYLMSADASVAPNEILTSDGSVWNTTPPTLGLVVRVSQSATSSLAGKMLRYNGSQWVVRVLNNLPPFRPSQYKSQSNENFYLVVVDRRATLRDDDIINVLDDLKIQQFADMKYTYYFKILDNGSDYLKLDRPITTHFQDTLSSAASGNRLTPACMTIVSDRIAANSPDFFDTLEEGTSNRGRFEYMRITLCGGNHSDDSLRLGALVMGPSISLSYPDFNLGYSYGLDEGSSLFDSLSGRRKSRRNHKPRKNWNVSYAPRPSAETTIVSAGFGTEVMNTVGGNGNYDDPIANAAQNSKRARASWQELLERVLAMGINGPMLALGFDGNNMQTLAGTVVNTVPKGKNIRPALSDPNGLCPVRLTGYAGATNVAFQGSQIISTSQGGTKSDPSAPQVLTNQTECVPSAVMEIKGLKFSEEL